MAKAVKETPTVPYKEPKLIFIMPRTRKQILRIQPIPYRQPINDYKKFKQ